MSFQDENEYYNILLAEERQEADDRRSLVDSEEEDKPRRMSDKNLARWARRRIEAHIKRKG